MSKHWIMDVTRAEVAGRTFHLAAIVDGETKKIITTALDIRAGRALGDAFRIAVGAQGVPGSLTVGDGEGYAVVAREAAKLGVEVRIIPPYNATAKGACERALRDFTVNRYRFPVKGR